MDRFRYLYTRLRDRYQDLRYGKIDPSLPVGRRGEQAAARMLRGKGYRVIAESERSFSGEIDLIAVDRRTVVFVEVKTLSTPRPGHPADRVDADKQRRLTRAALVFLKRNKLLEHSSRFDVVAIWWPEDAAVPAKIEHYVNAFEAVGEGQFFS